MKKMYVFVFVIFIVWQIQGVYAQSYDVWNDNVAEVCITYSSPNLNVRDIYKGYTTTNKNEINMIKHYLKSLLQIEGGGVPTDSRHLCITLKYSDANFKRFDIYPTTLNIIEATNQSVYKIPITKYYRMCDFINGLILGKFDSNIDISTKPSKWAETYVSKTIANEILPEWSRIGYTNDISRVEVCQLIDNFFTVESIDKIIPQDYTYLKEYPFDDTRDISVKELYVKGIVNGKSETEFCPYDNITREEFAKILSSTYDVWDLPKADGKYIYADDDDISDWAKSSVNKMYYIGLMQGKEDNMFKPKDNITKEEVIISLFRLSQLVSE